MSDLDRYFGAQRDVTLTVRLPDEIADQAEEIGRNDPEFLSRVVLYGLTRRSIYRHLRRGAEAVVVALLVLAGAACSDPLGPDDPEFDELCTLYVGVGEPAEITHWQMEHCEVVRVVVVRFGDGDDA